MKRIGVICLALLLPLLLTACSGKQSAGDTPTEGTTAPQTEPGTAAPAQLEQDGLSYSRCAEGWMITDGSGVTGELTVPAELDGTPVYAIGNRAFAGNTALTSVTLTAGIRELGSEAFRNCTGLTSVTVPATVSVIGFSAFAGTPWLAALADEEWVICGDGVLIAWNGSAAILTVPNDKGIRAISDAFRDRNNLIQITIPEGVSYIGAYAFADCTALKTLGLPKKLAFIANSSVAGCTALTMIKN